MDRHIRRAQKLRTRLGGDRNAFDAVPEKPPRMHWRTYDRLACRYYEVQVAVVGYFRASLDRLEARVRRHSR